LESHGEVEFVRETVDAGVTVSAPPARRYSGVMAQDTDPQDVAEAPPVVTEQGKARARETLASAKARRDPAMLAALRERFGHRPNRLA
jgi:hypothetical protein